jgi:hypothetical protein
MRCILDRMVSSLPLIATAIGNMPTVIFDDGMGVLVRPNDINRSHHSLAGCRET